MMFGAEPGAARIGERFPVGPVEWRAAPSRSHARRVTTRLGFGVIVAGVALLLLRTFGWVDTELLDIASVLGIVVGALVVAIDGEAADKPAR